MLNKFLQIIEFIESVLWGLMALFPWILVLALLVLEFAYGGIPVLNNATQDELIITVSIIIAALFIWAAYTIHVLTNSNLNISEKTVWALSLFFFGFFTSIFYWLQYIKNKPKKQTLFESKSSFDKNMIEPFLTRLSKVIDSGIDVLKVNELLLFTTNIEPNKQNETTFCVTQGCHKERVIYRVFADDIDSYSVHIYASKKITKLINTEINFNFNELNA